MAREGQATNQSQSSTHRVQITYDLEVGDTLEKRELPFVIGVLADLVGRPDEPLPRLRDRKFVEIDRDNFDAVLRGMRPRLAFRVKNTLTKDETLLAMELRFNHMADFEPENVVRQVAPLRELLEARIRLANLGSSLNDVLEDLLQKVIHSTESLQEVAGELSTAETPSYGLIEQIVDQGRLAQSEYERELGKEWVRECFTQVLRSEMIVSRDLESMITARIMAIDELLSEQLNEIMHAPEFQTLEASWRGLEYLVSRTETAATLKIRLLNVSKNELLRDLERAPEFDHSRLFKKVYEEEYGMFGGAPFSVLIGDYYFDRGPQDITLLNQLANVSTAAHAPFIAAASPQLFNLDSFTDLNIPRDLAKIFDSVEYAKWKSFRESENSFYVALTLPHILMRLPYHPETVPVEAFNFTEDVDGTEHSKYLWGNAAYAFAARLMNAFQQYGWCAAIRGSESGGLVQGLPTHTFLTENGDAIVKCPTEVAISDRRRAELAALGFIALCHNKSTDEAIFFEVSSCHQPHRYETDEANARARCAGQLEYIMAVSRFAHYLRAILRDKKGSFMSSGDCQKFLNTWIAQYVQTDDSMSEETKARYPLRSAHIEVKDIPGRPGVYHGVVFLQPQFQLYHLTIPLSFMTRLHSGGSLWLDGW